MSNAEFVAALSQERNRGFNTAVGTAEVLDRNTIPAVMFDEALCEQGRNFGNKIWNAYRLLCVYVSFQVAVQRIAVQ